jgi:phosphatidylglycerol:prolipoprotein diacylglycerol transferase
MGQILSLPLIIIGILIMVWSFKKPANNNKLKEQV